MTQLPAFLSFMTLWDFAAATYLIVSWLLTGHVIERQKTNPNATGGLMSEYRMQWLQQSSLRENRIMDAMLLNGLRSGSAFFASASLAALGAAVALLGHTDQLSHVATDLAADLSAPRAAWIVKLMVVIAILASGFLSFVWSHRVFGYCSVMLGAMPNDLESPDRDSMARKAGELNVSAAKHYNRGLRAIYYALAALAWLVGTWALVLSVALTTLMLMRREFRSMTRSILMGK